MAEACPAERRACGGAGGVDSRIVLRVDPEHGSLRARDVPALGEGTIEGNGSGQARLLRGEQKPHHPAAEAEPGRSDLLAGKSAAKLRHPRLHVRNEARCGSRPERSHRLELVRERRGSALFRQQVDRQRRVAARRQAARDSANRVVQPSVLVHHQHTATRLGCGRPGAHEPPALRPAEHDLASRSRRGLGLSRLRLRRRSRSRRDPHPRPCLVGQNRSEQRRGRRAAQPEQSQPAQRLAPGDEPVRMILGDLLGQIPLQLRHDVLRRISLAMPLIFSAYFGSAAQLPASPLSLGAAPRRASGSGRTFSASSISLR